MSTEPTLLIDKRKGVVTLTINRPHRRNALDPATYGALSHALQDADRSNDVNVIVITGADNNFTAGNDLQEFQKRGGGESAGMSFLRVLVKVQTPIVAAVEGYALGVGVTMLQHCDYVYVAENASMKLPFVNLGLCPEGASSLLLARLVGQRKASDWLLSGRTFTGTEAAQSGFATSATLPGEALAHAQKTAEYLCTQPRDALRLTKVMLRAPLEEAIDQTLTYEAEQFAARLQTAEAQQAFAQFFEKSASKKK